MSAKSLRVELEAAQTNAAVLAGLREEYTARYPHHWLAASGGRLFGPVRTSGELRILLEQAGEDLASAQAAYLDPDVRPLIL